MTHNPWNLSDREAEVLAALVKHGSSKVVAKEFGLSHRTIEHHVSAAKFRMGVEHRTQAIIAWDRYKRGAA